jgi:epoxide hydrolase 4
MTQLSMGEVRANGLRFAIRQAGDGDDVALCLHGFPESGAAFDAQLPALANLGWRAVAPDLRGYGGSERPPHASDYRLERLLDDVAGLFDALGSRRRLLIGHDWGGVIAWQAALSGRIALDGLVILNAPHPAVFNRVLRSGWRQKLKSWYVLMFQLPLIPEWVLTRRGGVAITDALARQSRTFPQERLQLYARNICAPGAARAMVNYYRANVGVLGRAREYPDLTIPTLMIWGENDVALDIALTEGLEHHVRDFTLHRLPGASHWVQEDAPSEINQCISDWARARGLP